ncbi:MAG: HAMP domain-containing histidine kinase, partial [Phycisphaerae bacterium]|nr:HAMP domain-containing histidine kinase [Phycisphaerae bacterium]
ADGEANDEKTRNEFYSVIQNQAKRLNRLIEDILNVSRIESGLVKVEKKPVSLELLIEEQLKMIKSYAEEKDITVTWGGGNIGSNSNIIVMGQIFADKDMISQVLVNLLSNAVKYTKNGGTIKVTSEINDKDEIARVTVIDSGVGIPEDEVEHVFDKFYRVSANNKQAKGTGLGLNLVKQIIEKVHGGKVFVSSEVGKGSTFGFDVPLATRDLIEQN